MPSAARRPGKKRNRLAFQEEFYSDREEKGMYYGVLIRSTAPFGMFTAFSHPELPDDYSIYRAGDLPGSNLIDTPQGKVPVFSAGLISYPGEPIGILVGPDENRLRELLDGIQIVYADGTLDEELRAALPEDAPPGDDPARDVLDDILYAAPVERKIERGPFLEPDEDGVPGTLDAIFSSAPHVVERCWSYRLRMPDYREPSGALCSYSDGALTIYTPTQWLSNLRQILSQALGIEPENITIKKTRSYNRGTNSIWYNSFIACQAAVAAMKCGHPVKLVYTRTEQELYIDTMLPVTILHKTAADEAGRLLAMKVDIDYDAGAYNPFAREILDRLTIASCGCYDPPNVSITAKAYRTANPPSSVDIQLIDSAAFFAVENQINELCKDYGEAMTPLDIRKANTTLSGSGGRALPFTFAFPQLAETLDALNSPREFERKYMAYYMDAQARRREGADLTQTAGEAYPVRGIGLACAFEGSGYLGSEIYGSNSQSLEVTAEEDGSITIHCAPVSKSIQDIWSRQAAAILDVSASAVRINSAFSVDKEPLMPDSVYSNISVMTDLLKKCCEAVRRKRTATPLPFSVTKAISPAQKKAWNQKEFAGNPFHSTSVAAASVEVEFDPCTFRESIRQVKIIINGGRILNPRAAESAIRLAIQKIFSTLVDSDTLDFGDVRISFIDSPGAPTQVGELVYLILPAAYTQAISQALDCTVPYLPLQTDSLYKLLREKKRKLHFMAMPGTEGQEAGGKDT